ncbi:hypothetical protein AYO21_11464 [Fonsecaea monophora]|uniref:Uncharacterized protein n=1 Tax=Fonsecaea monophora TaxID=254056 RepID=A0A177ER06_9EURO|nr:hypothetical protein AYO21_11464 [Fonsecaea monophora]OAG34378.1 hypothetical protein AYO21_11464 [Fonsecaea monophora]
MILQSGRPSTVPVSRSEKTYNARIFASELLIDSAVFTPIFTLVRRNWAWDRPPHYFSDAVPPGATSSGNTVLDAAAGLNMLRQNDMPPYQNGNPPTQPSHPNQPSNP